jgi:hypothetical protein
LDVLSPQAFAAEEDRRWRCAKNVDLPHFWCDGFGVTSSFDICEPRSLDEAFALLDPEDPAIRPIGGGTALMLMMKAQVYKPQRLVSLRRLGGRFDGCALSADGGSFRIGAMTTFAELEHSPQIRAHLPVIPQAMRSLANVRVRNVATVGGNLAHADPHLDLPPIWVALAAWPEDGDAASGWCRWRRSSPAITRPPSPMTSWSPSCTCRCGRIGGAPTPR